MERLLKRRAAGESGFTLIELLVVVAILAVLAGIVVLSLSGFSDDSKTTACEIDLRTLKTAAEVTRTETGSYPASEAAMVSAGFLEDESEYYNYTTTPAGDPAYSVQDADCPTP